MSNDMEMAVDCLDEMRVKYKNTYSLLTGETTGCIQSIIPCEKYLSWSLSMSKDS